VTTQMAPLPTRGASFNDVRRRLAALMQGAAPVVSPVPLELVSRGVQDAPTLRDADVIEAGGMRAHRVEGANATRFSAFLDGAQWSRVIWAGGIPVVHGTVAAVVRRRVDRRLSAWRPPIVRRALYAPQVSLPHGWADALADNIEIVDTLEKRKPQSEHPFELQEIAYQAILGARETLEKELAEDWCESCCDDLFIDGGISGSAKVAKSGAVVGVVKSHQKLYAHATDLPIVLGLEAGERSSVVRIAESRRSAVWSWYLRLRDAAGRDPFWGLVRVEVAVGDDATSGRRADDVSRWILAEALPLSVPDARWDKMVYGIRDCEEYLRAIQ
jgi:hypothetical protein